MTSYNKIIFLTVIKFGKLLCWKKLEIDYTDDKDILKLGSNINLAYSYSIEFTFLNLL